MQPLTFDIIAAESQASFTLQKICAARAPTVVGVTSDIAGSVDVVLGDPSASSISDILVSARDLTTDNDMRNRGIALAHPLLVR